MSQRATDPPGSATATAASTSTGSHTPSALGLGLQHRQQQQQQQQHPSTLKVAHTSPNNDHLIRHLFHTMVMQPPLQQQQQTSSSSSSPYPPVPHTPPPPIILSAYEQQQQLTYRLCVGVNDASRDSWHTMKTLLEARNGLQVMHGLFQLVQQIIALVPPQQQQSTSSTQNSSGSSTPSSSSASSVTASSTQLSVHHIQFLRGAVFFAGMASWGSQRIVTLQYPFTAVLAHLDHVMACNNTVVVYEVLLAIRRLVKKYGANLKLEWEPLRAILIKVNTTSNIHHVFSQFALASY